jgi:hypothetical protein
LGTTSHSLMPQNCIQATSALGRTFNDHHHTTPRHS